MASSKKNRRGLLDKLNRNEYDQVLDDLKNSDTSKSVESFNKAIKHLETSRKNSIPDDSLMRTRYDAFRK